MSGSSFNYLYSKVEQGEGRDEFVRWAPDLLEWIGRAERAQSPLTHEMIRDFALVLALIQEAQEIARALDRRLQGLVDVMKTVEWYSSGDWGESEVLEAVQKLAKKIRSGA